jgi:pimeloyl-ACP methyl ester carboxylesterase
MVPFMQRVDVSAGPIEYEDTGGDGPVLVLLHGVAMDGNVFDPVVADLRADHRCIVPTLPLGAHRLPMRADADLTLRGFGRIVAELLERLDLRDATLVQNDHAAAIAAAGEWPARIGRLVLSSCEAFENYPPGLPGKNLALMSRIPGALNVAMQGMRFRALRRLPVAIGWLTKRPLPHELTDAWFEPIRTNPAIRRDLARYARTAKKQVMVDATARLRSFDRPTLVIWTPEDRIMPPDHGRRLAELLPNARLVEVADSYTLIQRDQPVEFARLVREFVATT